MNGPPDVRARPEPSRAGLVVFIVFVVIDILATLGLGGILVDALSDRDGIDGGFAICVGLIIVAVLFTAGAIVAMRRQRRALAMVLAAIPAIPSALMTAAVLFFIATFHHQP